MQTPMQTPRPSFFVAGAPKCGTTALYTNLRAHAGVYLPELKEPHFHSTDLPGLCAVEGRAGYDALFAPAPAGALIGEASASYLMSETAVPRILAETPTARFVVILRNPAEMAAAMHGELCANLSEDVTDFAAAWALIPERRAGRRLPPRAAEPQMLDYARVCAIGTQLERFVARVPEHQRLILTLDEMRADAAAVHTRLLGFLGLAPAALAEAGPVNARRRLRSRRLAAMHQDLPRLLGPVYGPAKRLGNALGLSPSALVSRLNVAAAPRAALDPGFAADLAAHFAPEIDRIEAVLGRDLSHWRAAR